MSFAARRKDSEQQGREFRLDTVPIMSVWSYSKQIKLEFPIDGKGEHSQDGEVPFLSRDNIDCISIAWQGTPGSRESSSRLLDDIVKDKQRAFKALRRQLFRYMPFPNECKHTGNLRNATMEEPAV
jgi:hypothetical protein